MRIESPLISTLLATTFYPVIHLLPIYHDFSVRRMSPMLTFNDFTILDLSLHAIGGNTAHSFVAA